MASHKQTTLFSTHRQMGARMTDRAGWQTASSFTSARQEVARVSACAGLADVSWMTKVDLKGAGVHSLAALDERSRSWAVGPTHLLVTCDPEARESVLAQASSADAVSVTEVTSVFAQLVLAGPRARDILRKLTSLNVSEAALPDLGCGQTNLAHVRGSIVLRQDLGRAPAFHILVGRDYGEDVWDSLLHAGHEFDLAPFGIEAFETLGS
jgi:heterotetrameric sarcosine oxidase gamma subunit